MEWIVLWEVIVLFLNLLTDLPRDGFGQQRLLPDLAPLSVVLELIHLEQVVLGFWRWFHRVSIQEEPPVL